MSTRPFPFIAAGLITVLVLGGCYTPKGGAMPGINSAATYWSTEMAPKTVTVVDTRTGEEVFVMDIPPGKQLVMNFSDDNPQEPSGNNTGDDPVYRPALMTYQVMELGQMTGKLSNSMTVPGVWARRVDVSIRKSGEIPPPPPEVALRVDQEVDRPAWWTPKGGAMPPKFGDSNYDR